LFHLHKAFSVHNYVTCTWVFIKPIVFPNTEKPCRDKPHMQYLLAYPVNVYAADVCAYTQLTRQANSVFPCGNWTTTVWSPCSVLYEYILATIVSIVNDP